jgi:hypothetical protein
VDVGQPARLRHMHVDLPTKSCRKLGLAKLYSFRAFRAEIEVRGLGGKTRADNNF